MLTRGDHVDGISPTFSMFLLKTTQTGRYKVIAVMVSPP